MSLKKQWIWLALTMTGMSLKDYNDPDVYTMLRNGETIDIFQMSSYTPAAMLADFNACDIDGVCAVNAGNRPGPLEKDAVTNKSMVDLFVESSKTGIIQSIHPDIDPILKDTMGCIWYQEHLISLGQIMAVMTLVQLICAFEKF